ncbi:MAG: hypothetical protein HGB05_19145, partial [Chloroflexi bacterium]|nr:hypothetical protein [Chloroflexota bacterium]
MSHRVLSACAILILLVALVPISLPESIGVDAAAPMEPLNPNAVCLYVPPAARSSSASSTA